VKYGMTAAQVAQVYEVAVSETLMLKRYGAAPSRKTPQCR
jgi:hypothetical protein